MVIKFALAEDQIIDICTIEFLAYSPISQVVVSYFTPSVSGFVSNDLPLDRVGGEYGYVYGIYDYQRTNIVSSIEVTLKAEIASMYTVELKLFNGEDVDFTKLGDKLIYINVLDENNEIVYQDTMFIDYSLVLNIKDGAFITEEDDGTFSVTIYDNEFVLEHNPKYDTPITNYASVIINGGEDLGIVEDGEYEFDFLFVYNIDTVEYTFEGRIIITKATQLY